MSTFCFKITNYDNQAMADNPTGETCRLLRSIADRVEDMGVRDFGARLMDGNGNHVGIVEVRWDDDDDDEVFDIDAFTLQECHDWLCDADIDNADMPSPNPWDMNRSDAIAILGLESTCDADTDSLIDIVIDQMNNGILDGLDAWRQACHDKP